MTPPALRFQQVELRYGATPVLQSVDLSVQAGECVALIFGQPHRQPTSRAALGYLPEQFIPPYYLTGAEFIRYVLRLQGVEYQPDQVVAMLAALDLAPAALEQRVGQYSKGMTQKLGLAACLLAHKPLYVLDEPMSGLDPRAHARLRQQLADLRARGSS
eukprot:gene17418-17246_t